MSGGADPGGDPGRDAREGEGGAEGAGGAGGVGGAAAGDDPHEPVGSSADAALCDLCGSPMRETHCKLVCDQCGYIRDCSDP